MRRRVWPAIETHICRLDDVENRLPYTSIAIVWVEMERLDLSLSAVMARAASTYGRIGPDLFKAAAQGLVEEVGVDLQAHVLDLGCGPGTVASLLSEAGRKGRVICVDLVLDMVCEARDRLALSAGPNLDFVVMNAGELGFPDSLFDVVVCAGAIYQMPDGLRATREMLRVLRPDGIIGLSAFDAADPRWSGVGELYRRLLAPLPPAGRRFDGQALAALLEDAGAIEVRLAERRLDVVYADAGEWLASAWSHGERRAFEAMDAQTYRAFVHALPAAVEQARQVDGRLHWRPKAIYACGRRSPT